MVAEWVSLIHESKLSPELIQGSCVDPKEWCDQIGRKEQDMRGQRVAFTFMQRSKFMDLVNFESTINQIVHTIQCTKNIVATSHLEGNA